MRDAIDDHSAELLDPAIARVLAAIESAGSEWSVASGSTGEPAALRARVAATLRAVRGRLAEPRPAPPHGGADPAAVDDGADGSVPSSAVFRAAVRSVAHHLPPGPDRTAPLLALATAVHEALGTATGETQLLDRLHRSHLDERRRVARELHDVVAHSVAVALQDLELFAVHRDRDGRRAEARLTTALDHLRDTLDTLRAITQDLRRSAAPRGLTAALRSYLEAASPDCPTELAIEGDENRIPPAVQGELFLILREAVRNALVHGGGAAVRVRVVIGPAAIRATVSDHGRGFDPAAPREPDTGSGLASMAERVALLGGTIDVRSAPERGASISVDVPLVRASDDPED